MPTGRLGQDRQEPTVTKVVVNPCKESCHGQAENGICSRVTRSGAAAGEGQGGSSHHVKIRASKEIIDDRSHMGRSAQAWQECHVFEVLP